VTITQAKKREKVSIQIPSDSPDAEDQEDAKGTSDQRGTRFWT
jgi:hypothetical protein